MKPVIEKTIAKDGSVLIRFNATPKMVLAAITIAQSPHLSEEEVCESLRMDKRSFSRWRSLYGSAFNDWLDEALDIHSPEETHKKKILEAVGMINAVQGNYQFWRDMARTNGVIKEEVKNQSITINTDFSQIAIGADFNETRRALLKQLTGVEYAGEPRMAETTLIGQRESTGSGTRDVQSQPVVLDDSLGSNRRRPRERPAVSKLPSKATSGVSD